MATILADRLHVKESRAVELAKNGALTSRLIQIIDLYDKSTEIPQKHSKLIFHWCSNVKVQFWEKSLNILDLIQNDKIVETNQLDYALNYIVLYPDTQILDNNSFDEFIGVGVEITTDQIKQSVDNVISSDPSLKPSLIISKVYKDLKFANRLHIVEAVTKKLKTTQVSNPQAKKSNRCQNETKDSKSTPDAENTSAAFTYAQLFTDTNRFHKVGEHYKADGYPITPTTMEHLKRHVERTGGKVVTRFPPEASGTLHIGHLKAINVDFGFAKFHNGITYLRFDDTNPEKGEQRFVDEIVRNVEWLGYTPYKITYTSDNFDKLFTFAVKLIEMGHAYVCHMTKEKLKGRDIEESPWRGRPVQESLAIFNQMRDGLIKEGDATLRLKYTMEDGKVDPVIYRVIFQEHTRTGNKWCIFPSYDFSHSICDSLEDVSHSMCTTEFRTHRSIYYWLCNVLDIYCPVQWEFGRLNVTHSVVSKRKLAKIINKGFVDSWDDPRLFTLSALRRRGIPVASLFKFTEANSATTSNSFISPSKLEAFARKDLNETSPRAVAILRPLRAKIVNFDELDKSSLSFEKFDFPDKENRGSAHTLHLEPKIFIDANDCDPECVDKKYLRLKYGQKVGLFATKLQLEIVEGSKIVDNEINVRISPVTGTSPKVYIQWLTNPLVAEIRVYNKLFIHEYPEKPELGGFLNDINPNSLERYDNALVERRLASSKCGDSYQFLREGYFCVDSDSSSCKLVFNLTVRLRETWNN